jgi:hypothetical protein
MTFSIQFLSEKRSQITQYSYQRKANYEITKLAVQPNTNVYDLDRYDRDHVHRVLPQAVELRLTKFPNQKPNLNLPVFFLLLFHHTLENME